VAWKKAVAGILLLALGLSALAQGAAVAFSLGEWPPYVGESLPGKGMAAELVGAACAASGLRAEYAFYPWRRAEDNVRLGASFGTFPYKELPERTANYVFSATLFSSSFALASLAASARTAAFRYSSIADLKGLRVGITAGTDALLIPLRQAGIEVEEAQDPELSIRKLELGRIDVYIDDKAVMHQALLSTVGRPRLGEFRIEERAFGERSDFKVMVSRRYPGATEILARLNEGLGLIRKSGEYARILARYGM
jgi:polar amino acid transport system substrate-binding protein